MEEKEKIEQQQQTESTKEKFIKSNWWQAIKFTLFSISAGVIQFGVFALLSEVFFWDFWPSHLISVTLSVIWNFTFNRKFTFKASNNVPIAMLLVLVFYAAFIPASVFGGQALKDCGWDALLVEALMMVINFVTEFFWQKFIVFNTKIVPDRKEKTQKTES
ncbi:MAG: GtrA family protein [Clostridia bacterium]|nr:GtrA family protein [Clostridia bacterium]